MCKLRSALESSLSFFFYRAFVGRCYKLSLYLCVSFVGILATPLAPPAAPWSPPRPPGPLPTSLHLPLWSSILVPFGPLLDPYYFPLP